jgi:hypothetical protein
MRDAWCPLEVCSPTPLDSRGPLSVAAHFKACLKALREILAKAEADLAAERGKPWWRRLVG